MQLKEKKRKKKGRIHLVVLSWCQINVEVNPHGRQTEGVSVHSHHMPTHVNKPFVYL